MFLTLSTFSLPLSHTHSHPSLVQLLLPPLFNADQLIFLVCVPLPLLAGSILWAPAESGEQRKPVSFFVFL